MILLVSGGLDSYIAYNFLKQRNENLQILFVNYGQLYYKQEQEAINILYDNVHHVDITNLPILGAEIHIPARNLMLATIALRFSNNIYFGAVKDEQCSDKSPKAFKEMGNILSKHSSNRIIIDSPIWKYTKSEAVSLYINSGFDKSHLMKTISCYSDFLCNNCEACFRRSIALAVNGIVDENRIPSDDIIKYFIKRIHLQPYNRALDIIRGLKNMGVRIDVMKLSDYRDSKYFKVVISDKSSLYRRMIENNLDDRSGLLLEHIVD